MTRRVRIAATTSGLGLVALVALPLAAQEDGGLRLSFGISARIESASNPGLSVPAEPNSDTLSSRLSFGLTDTTRMGEVSMSVAGTLSTDNDDATEDGLIDPDLRLAVRRIGATSSLELSAFLSERDLDSLRGFVLDPDTGNITEDLLGDGIQNQTGGTVTYSFGEGGPWGGSLSGGVTDTTYSGDTTEVDNNRTNLDGTLRFELDPATEVTAGLGWSTYDEEGDDPRDTLRPELSFRRDRPAGFVSASAFAEDTEDGTRAGLSFGRSWERPGQSFGFSLGATRGVTGNLTPTGRVDWQKDLPRGSLNVNLLHEVTSGDDDEETIITTVNVGLSHSVSPLASVSFGLNASDSQDTTTDETTQNVSLSATFSQSLPNDWMFDAGVTHRIRNEDNAGDATSDSVFLELRRAFEWRP